MFAFDLASIVLTIFLGILLQIICWTYDRWPGKVTLVLFIVAVVTVVIELIFLLVCWSILFGHPQFMRQSLGVASDWCAGGQVDTQSSNGNVLCVWNGKIVLKNPFFVFCFLAAVSLFLIFFFFFSFYNFFSFFISLSLFVITFCEI